MKATKIVCTIGPASDSKTKLRQLIKAGMNVARLNFSHNVHAYHLAAMKNIQAVSRESNSPVGIIIDLQGPRIRLGDLPTTGIKLVGKKRIILTTDDKKIEDKIPVTYKRMHLDVKPGERVLIADGLMSLLVEKVVGKDIFCKVLNGGLALSHKGMNLPDTDLKIPTLSDKDEKDVLFAVKNKADFIALSFVRNARDVAQLRSLIERTEKKLKIKEERAIMIVVKIERREAVEKFDEILAVADGVMVARGDLGIELPLEDVPLVQKMIIDKCLRAAKPVIVATQMLESMITNPRPTRAEVSDVANAVIDHADAVMLSGETATGKYPLEAVNVMSKVIEATEKSAYDDLRLTSNDMACTGTMGMLSQIVKMISLNSEVKVILGATMSGYTGRIISRYRPEKAIYIACIDERVLRQLCLSWGVQPFKSTLGKDYVELTKKGKEYLKKRGLVKKGDEIIIIAGVTNKNLSGKQIIELDEV